METQPPDALIKDERAVELVTRMGRDFDRIRQIPMKEVNKVVPLLRNREFDRYAQAFLRRHPEAVVVHIGCGLDSRFERVDNGQVKWYDLDLPDVMALSRKYIGDERERYHLLGFSTLEDAWIEAVSAHRQRIFLPTAEGVFPYLKEQQVKSLVSRLRNHFPGAELVFDAISPFELWVGNLRLARSKLGARARWALRRGQEIEGWGDGICLLVEWGFFDDPTPRLDHIRWMQHISLLARALRIYHFRLGEVAR